MTIKRCAWCTTDPLYISYHDNEWGLPLKDDQKLFELLILEGMQAGLSWLTVLKKRENFRKAFDHFNPNKIVLYSEKKIEKLLADPGIIRNRLKIAAVINNAHAYLQLLQEYKSFNDYIWQFAPKNNKSSSRKVTVITRSIDSDAMSKDLQKKGFKFVGTTICYAFMQASGMVNDHEKGCFLYKNK
jgi:DNA-3-methyladenine glycosylase I